MQIEYNPEASEMFSCLREQPDKAPKNWEFYEKGTLREGLVSWQRKEGASCQLSKCPKKS